MRLVSLLVGLFLLAGVAQGASGGEWGGMQGPRDRGPALKQAPSAVATMPIIDDPVGDHITSVGNPIVDIDTVEGGTNGVEVTLRITFSPDTVMSQVVGFIDLDTDQDPTTGEPPNANFFIPGTSQEIGVDFFLSLFNLPSGGPVDVLNAVTGALVGSVPATIIGQTLEVTVPLTMLGGDDGAMDVGMVLGNPLAPTDAAPNAGHGTIVAVGMASISPGSSTLVTTQDFDLVFIINPLGNPITGVSIAVNGVDITAGILGSGAVFGSTPTGQFTVRRPAFGAVLAGVLGPGSYTFSIVVTTAAGTFGDTVTYEIIQNTEPG